jgi:hypothetical protein
MKIKLEKIDWVGRIRGKMKTKMKKIANEDGRS